MRRLNWWQWTIIVVLAIAVLNALADPKPRKQPAAVVAKTYAKPDAEFEAIGNDIFAMTFDEGADPAVLPDLAREHCDKRKFCKVLAWTDPKYTARAMPMTEREVDRLAFSYSLNRETGYDKAVWDCKRWKRTTPNECL